MAPAAIHEIKQHNILEESTKRMNAIMSRKLTILHEIYGLSEQASGYINERDIERLNNIIDEKQLLIDRADGLDKLFLSESDALKSSLDLNSLEVLRISQTAQLKDLQNNTADILAMIKKLYDMEIDINCGILKLRDDITADLNRIRKQKQISALYSRDDAIQRANESHVHAANGDYLRYPGNAGHGSGAGYSGNAGAARAGIHAFDIKK